MKISLYNMNSDNKTESNFLIIGLWLCFGIFVFRVIAQLLVFNFDIPVLPAFDTWYSGAINYKSLLIWQAVIIIIMATFAYRFSHQLVIPRRNIGYILLTIGGLYFTSMFIRLIISLFGLSELVWFSRPIPSFFHLVLATYILLAGRYHTKHKSIIKSFEEST